MTIYYNTLYVTQPDTYLSKSQETVVVKQQGSILLQIPIHHLISIVCMGSTIRVSPELMHSCFKHQVSISFFCETGRFRGRVEGVPNGNVLLRRAQYRLADDAEATRNIALRCIQGKIANSRTMLQRYSRETSTEEAGERINQAVDRLADALSRLKSAESLNSLRGIEGEAAAVYFNALAEAFKQPDISFNTRNRRPPKDPVNAVLSFLYALLAHDCTGALSAVSLDPQVGYLHVDRPGRPSLSLDLMEEFRPILVDRLVVRLFNLRQLTNKDFETDLACGVLMKEAGRRLLVQAYQESKHEEIIHPFLNQKVHYGLLPLMQARLLAKAIRGEISDYVPYLLR
jgi:CRISPR-associated protein Cas1